MKLDGISSEDIMHSLSVELNRNQAFKAGQGAGASGSFFFFSYDHRFIIKTMTNSEKNNLLEMLDDLILHYKAGNNSSLIARIYGVFRVQTNSFKPFNFMIMQNTCEFDSYENPRITFDLKGSTINRKIKTNEKFWLTDDPLSFIGVLKDQNLIEI